MAACSAKECTERAVTKGYCPKHYARFRKHGDPEVVLSSGSIPVDPKARFESKYLVDPDSGCWQWTGAANGNGWPTLSIGQQAKLAHRFAFETYRQEIPEGYSVTRTCGNVGCVNPDHMELVSNDPEERFWSNVVRRDDGHWVWKSTGSVFRVEGKSYSPRRFAYKLVTGKAPTGPLYVLCGFAKCVNPDHVGLSAATFWAKVDKNKDGCWYWLGSKLPTGYPHLTFNGKSVYAHRLSYVWAGGTLEEGAVLTQTCGHKDCVNPKHLEQISYQEMVNRREARKRQAKLDKQQSE